MVERLLIVMAAAGLGIAVYRLLRRSQLGRAQSAAAEQKGLQLKTGTPHVIYFWSEHCPQCRSAQKPTLDRLLETVGAGNIELITIQVEEREDLATSWGVRTLPTTYVLDRRANVSHVNSGLASESRLLKQLDLVAT